MGSLPDMESTSERDLPPSLRQYLLNFCYLGALLVLLAFAAHGAHVELVESARICVCLTILLALAFGIRRCRPQPLLPWLLLIVIVLLWLLRILPWSALDSGTHGLLVFATDLGMLLFFAVLVRKRNVSRDVLLWLDIGIIALSCSLLMLRYMTVDQWQVFDSEPLTHLRMLALPLCHTLVVAGFMGVALTMRGFNPSLWLVLLGQAMLVLVEIMRLDLGSPRHLQPLAYGVSWTVLACVGLSLFGAAALRPDMQRLGASSDFHYEPWGRAQVMLIFGVICLALIALAGAPSPLEQHPESWIMVGAAVLMQAVLLARCHVAIGAMHKARGELLRSTELDPLTGLPNQHALRKKLALQDTSTRRFGLALIDINRFNQINHTWGYEVGDQVLLATVRLLLAGLPRRVRLYRVRGDVFALLLRVRSPAQSQLLQQLARGVLEKMRTPLLIGYQRFYLSVSIGISQHQEGPPGAPETVLRDADIALFQAKRRGGNALELFQPVMQQEIVERQQVASALRVGLGREFRLAYQPIVTVATCQVVSHEVLLRWRSAALGEVSPGVFIPVAEESGLIGEVTHWVLTTVFAQLAQLPPQQRLAVNISACDLRDAEFLPMLDRLCEEYQVDPARVVLEFTEGTLVEDFEHIALPLRARGFRIAIDDFGTGYSSLSYLMTLAASTVKLDISFIAGIEHDLDQRALVAGLITLCGENGLRVVAEGVETEAQHEILRDMGCEFAQGWFYGRPGPQPLPLDATIPGCAA